MDVSKYASLFLTESREHLSACNKLLLEWERTPSAAEPVDGLFRAVHTIKGMAATMGFANVTELAHRAENLLDAARTGRVPADDAVLQLLFRTVDALSAGVEAAALGNDGTVRAAELEAALDHAAGAEGAGTGGPAAPPDVPVAHGAVSGSSARRVRVTISSAATMRGARALLALRRAEALGTVRGVQPPRAQFEREEFAGEFAFALDSAAAEADIVAAIITAGDVEQVVFEDAAAADDRRAGAAGGAGRGRQIRVDLGRLDTLMKQVGELVVARNRLVDYSAQRRDEELDGLSGRIARLVSGMQSEILQARMTPVGEVFERFPRLVRDLARDLGKQIRLDLEGDEIELDRSILDEIGEPLLHLVRNAADHGIERPADRLAAGKPAEGRIRLVAERERNSVVIRVADDGRGIDRAAVLARAQRDGLADAGAEALSDEQLMKVLARPGFSMASAVSEVSGRGVGTDVVITRLRALGGTVDIRSEPGRGTTWALRVPLTLAIVRALLARVGEERYAVPLAFVAETVEFDRSTTTALRNREALVLRDHVIPTVHLRELVAVGGDGVPLRRPAIILEVGERRTALVVDALLGQQDIVVEPFEMPRGMPSYFGGATILADGIPALILDAAALV